MEFCKTANLNDTEHVALYRMVKSGGTQNFYWIFKLRLIIPPIWWFVSDKTDYRLSHAVKFIPCTTKENRHKMLLGQHILAYYNKNQTIHDIADKTGMKINHLRMYTYQKKDEEGDYKYRLNCTTAVAENLSEWINEDYWYVYAEEVTDKELIKKYEIDVSKREPIKIDAYTRKAAKIAEEWFNNGAVMDDTITDEEKRKQATQEEINRLEALIEDLKKKL